VAEAPSWRPIASRSDPISQITNQLRPSTSTQSPAWPNLRARPRRGWRSPGIRVHYAYPPPDARAQRLPGGAQCGLPYSSNLAFGSTAILGAKAMNRPWQANVQRGAARSQSAPSCRGGAAATTSSSASGEPRNQFEHLPGLVEEQNSNIRRVHLFFRRGNRRRLICPIKVPGLGRRSSGRNRLMELQQPIAAARNAKLGRPASLMC